MLGPLFKKEKLCTIRSLFYTVIHFLWIGSQLVYFLRGHYGWCFGEMMLIWEGNELG